ncbi:hypothetical protein PITCH_A810005 [uncultured Desulfobacterium sp.]|uniref:Uncharacterized protein n=1 Tax=uncultured Desulfobacterium sp. TaxID=201089 RepID=A0A445N2Z9_9BACT|nr:hypothetical protein PITCH_A810005 [uncultured Desulfobacterium sp.]
MPTIDLARYAIPKTDYFAIFLVSL